MNKQRMAKVIAAAACGYLLWQYLTPVEIVAVHRNIILVRHFPYLKSRQIDWWEANKETLKAKYGIPHQSEDGYYTVVIMDFGDGYRADRGTDEDSDLLCFDDMPEAARCIEKKPLRWIAWSQNTGQVYWQLSGAKFDPLPDRPNITGMNATVEITGRRDE